MRFLGLHGSGTSGAILKLQLASIAQSLPDITFDYISGYVCSDAGPGVGPFFDPPFFAWWKNKTEYETKQACDRLLAYIKRRQYDVIVCFSQGCSILSSLILYHQAEYPGVPLPFKGAVFICGGTPLYVLSNWMPVSDEARDIAEAASVQLSQSSKRSAEMLKQMLASGKRQDAWNHPTLLWDGQNDPSWDVWSLPPVEASNVYGLDVSNLPAEVQIKIPTVIIYGHKDPVSPSQIQLAMLCDEAKRRVYNHCGGHEVPRRINVTQDIVDAVRWLQDCIEDEN